MPAGPGHAHLVVQDVQLAVLLVDARVKRAQVVGAGGVDLLGLRRAAVGQDLLGHGLGGIGAQIDDVDVRTLGGEAVRDGAPHAGAATDDGSDAVAESPGHGSGHVLVLSSVRADGMRSVRGEKKPTMKAEGSRVSETLTTGSRPAASASARS